MIQSSFPPFERFWVYELAYILKLYENLCFFIASIQFILLFTHFENFLLLILITISTLCLASRFHHLAPAILISHHLHWIQETVRRQHFPVFFLAYYRVSKKCHISPYRYMFHTLTAENIPQNLPRVIVQKWTGR